MNKFLSPPLFLLMLIAIISFGFTTSQSYADGKTFSSDITKITVVMDDNYPPYIFEDSTGNFQGILVDQWHLWEAKTGIQVELYPMSWSDAQTKMKNDQYDVIDTIFLNEDRKLLYDFSKPYAKIDVAIYFPDNISGIAGVESLTGFTVAVKDGDACIPYLMNNGISSLQLFESYESMILAAKEGRASILVMDLPPAHFYMYRENIQTKFNYSKPLYTGEFHRAVKKGNTVLLDTVEKGFALISEKEYKEINKKWLGNTTNATKYMDYFMYSIGIVIILLLLLAGLSYTLKRTVNEKTKQLDAVIDDLKASEEKYRLMAENASDVIWIYNVSISRFTYVSPSVFQLRGLTAEEAIQESLEEWLTPASLAVVKRAIEKNVKAFVEDPTITIPNITEIRQPCKNGSIIWVEISTRYQYNENGDIEVIGISRNIDARKKSENEILYLSYHDQLTGLYNRRFYEEELTRLNTERNLPLTIVMGDVNGLKLINDSFGHFVGDELLRRVAEVIKEGCRADDIVARLGGDEFVLILPKTSEAEAEEVIKRIKKLAKDEKVGSIDLSISFGHVTKISKDEDIQETIKSTEDHMYRHKLYEGSSMRSKTIDMIMNTLYEKNNREMMHSKRVSELCEAIATKMHYDRDDINQIRIAGLMHDIGKIGIDEKILNKPEKLSSDEWHEMKRHSEIGYRILSSANEFSEIANYVLEHQERWDGTGYPKGLKGEMISKQARIIAVADAFDAMTSFRTYGKELSEADAINEILSCAGTQFDPDIARVLIEKVLAERL